MNLLEHKNILITGGTGFFGNTFIEYCISTGQLPAKLIVFSRDEQKHFVLEKKYPPKQYPFIQFEIGDIRDLSRISEVVEGVDIVIHAAAMKHIHWCERFPMECIKTNEVGTENVLKAISKAKSVSQCIFISTDKAVNPNSQYGISKKKAEELTLQYQLQFPTISFSVIRYGNVFGAIGSVVPVFLQCLHEGIPFPITDSGMTRFSILPKEGMQLVFEVIQHGNKGGIYVLKSPSYKIMDLVAAINPDHPIEIIGLREGEKLHEEIIAPDEALKVVDKDFYVLISPTIIDSQPYTSYTSSENSHFLSINEIQEQLKPC